MYPGDPKVRTTLLHPVWYLLVATLVLVVLTYLFANLTGAKSSVGTQPLDFNHYIHVEEEGEPCDACHRHFKTGKVAGRPELSTCLECHDEDPISDDLEEIKLIEFINENKDPPWVRVTRLPPHVRFSHQRHVMVGEIVCATCHGDIAKLTSPPSNPLISINMEFCIKCHRAKSFQINDKALKALKSTALNRELIDNMKIIRNRRFRSKENIVLATNKLSSKPITEWEEHIIWEYISKAESVTVDCIACHY